MNLWGLSFYTWKLWTKQNFLYHWKFCKILLYPFEIPRWKTETCENATWIFIDYPLKFHFYPWKYWTKQTFTFGNSVKFCYTLWTSLEIALLFQLKPRISTLYLFNTTPSPAPIWISAFCLSFSLSLSLSLYIYMYR